MDKKFGLVLEGGGFRGCYTAGALKWLYDHQIMFPYTVSISAASVYALLYHAGMMKELHESSTRAVKDKKFIGLYPLIKEGGIVGYSYLKETYFAPFYTEALRRLKESDREAEIGLFNMSKEKLEYYGKEQYDESGEVVKASCVLPITGKKVKINGNEFLDGGIDSMISIQRCIDTNHSKILVIVTKDKNYVRKPNGFFLANALRFVYRKYKKMLHILDGRVDRYYEEMNQIYQLENKGDAMLIRPSRDCGVGRFTGSIEQLDEMFNMGWQDMEDRKEEILAFLEMK